MRGRLTAGATLVALLATLALAGCGQALPAEVDAALVDDWKPVAEVTGWTPEAGACLATVSVDIALRSAAVKDCAEPHYGEVVHVGKFPGDTYPGPKEKAAALYECDLKAMLYLGRAWGHAAKLELRLSTPKVDTWTSGARWYRCEISEQASTEDAERFVLRTGSLKGAIPPALLNNCVKAVIADDAVSRMDDIACTTAHNAEYVGVFREPATAAYPDGSAKTWDRLHKTCGTLITQYLGVPASRAVYYGSIALPASGERWAAGDHTVQCAVFFDKTLRKSARDSKGKGLPS
ncbi:hypothetical protein Cme02nite_47640 [Catellatospora methionotrophica]|uniref:Septum formation-related domain-containing protein n=1 Tax=Catellatospora methionotrophica TaxID=121620 RepID=A0A8J3LC72_9ACTN|nr:septum formation family protein [Catellatospora methionotrophica]GIG16432.1 hypothetical protein Cme02nite_47640 [Catellatospora methionotrophica]